MQTRFLINDDYYSIITEDALTSIVRGDQSQMIKAEEAAEITILEYLMELYDIEKEIQTGKMILEYDRKICYPIDAHFILNNRVYKVIKSINGYKKPTSNDYWKVSDVIEKQIPRYSQFSTYYAGEVVMFNGINYECLFDHGYDMNDVNIPGVKGWEVVKTIPWQPVSYPLHTVVQYNSKFFTLFNMDNYNEQATPDTGINNWGEIAGYDATYNEYENSRTEYIVHEGEVFCPIMDVNSDEVVPRLNITEHDPRNMNIKKHMVRLALYELCKRISPSNVSTIRISDYEQSIKWLNDAARLRINPMIPRKVDQLEENITDWQMSTFQTDYDPGKNPWHV